MPESISEKIIACPVCGQPHQAAPLSRGQVADCVRCGSRIDERPHNSLHRTAAFALAGMILYVPANLLPILRLELYGAVSESTVWQGVVKFYHDGNYVISLIVLLASIVIPLIKLLGLFLITITVVLRWRRWQLPRTWLFRMIEGIGRWAMLDVFVLSIWVAVVKLGSLARVTPGRGLLPFGCVVVLTLLASASFDPQLIWLPPARKKSDSD